MEVICGFQECQQCLTCMFLHVGSPMNVCIALSLDPGVCDNSEGRNRNDTGVRMLFTL